MKLKTSYKSNNDENLIPLINVVFLMLIFFLIAGAIKTFSVKKIEMTSSDLTEKLARKAVKLQITKEGLTHINGESVNKDSLVEQLKIQKQTVDHLDVSIIPDKELSGRVLIEIIELVKQAPVRSINLIAIRKNK